MTNTTMRFVDQAAIVTGAGSGIGYTIAQRLAQEGAKVALNDIDKDLAHSAAQRINASSPCVAYPGNMASLADIQALVDDTLSQFGQIDLLVANAGITQFGDFFEVTSEDFQRVVDLNLRGTFFLVQAVARHWRDRGQSGRIVLMSSIIGLRSYPNLAVYSMTKAALNALSRSLVLDLAPHGIALNTLIPGATLTERTQHEGEDYERTWSDLNPNRRVGTTDDMANAVLFLLSHDAHHITGQTLTVDGGWTAVGRNPHDA